MPKIYIPNTGAGHNFSPAERFGSPLIYVTEGAVNPFNVGTLARAWRDALKNSSPDDFIIVTSLNALCMIGAAVFARLHGRLNILIFTKEGDYEPRRIFLDNIWQEREKNE